MLRGLDTQGEPSIFYSEPQFSQGLFIPDGALGGPSAKFGNTPADPDGEIFSDGTGVVLDGDIKIDFQRGGIKYMRIGNHINAVNVQDNISISRGTGGPTNDHGDLYNGTNLLENLISGINHKYFNGNPMWLWGNGLFEVFSKFKITPLGGLAVKLTNETGVVTVAGEGVKADTVVDDAVILTGAGDTENLGVFLDDGIADGAETWVVIAGIADVMIVNASAFTRGDWIGSSGVAGRCTSQASPPAAPPHFQEWGHCIESVGSGTDVKARCVLHQN